MLDEYDDSNIFKLIIDKKIKSNTILENEDFLCFRDINPKKKTHVLIIPKKPYANYHDFISNENNKKISAFFVFIKDVANLLNIKNGYKLETNCGKSSGQEVMHFHFHLLSDE